MEGLSIRPFVDDDAARLQLIRQRAFRPIFDSFREIVGREIAHVFDRADAEQADYLESLFAPAKDHTLFVADLRGTVVGFIDVRVDGQVGVIGLNAVDPALARRGIGTRMYAFAFHRFREAGLKVAQVSTGGDPGHAPARCAYAKAGFETKIPGVTFYRTL